MAFFVAEAKKAFYERYKGTRCRKTHHYGRFRQVRRKRQGDTANKGTKIVDKHYQPDTAAIIFTLTNGEPENWKNRQNNEVTGKDGKDLFGQLTDEELDARIAELERKLGK